MVRLSSSEGSMELPPIIVNANNQNQPQAMTTAGACAGC